MNRPPLWTLLLQNIWSRSFYVVPLLFPLFVSGVLALLRRHEFDQRTFLIAWFLGAPVGFLLWILAWQTYGGGFGRVSFTVGATALTGWCVWHRGLYVFRIHGMRWNGFRTCVFALNIMICAAVIIDRGTGPIRLALIATMTGTAVLITFDVFTKLLALLRLAHKKLAIPFWKFLNQPVALL